MIYQRVSYENLDMICCDCCDFLKNFSADLLCKKCAVHRLKNLDVKDDEKENE